MNHHAAPQVTPAKRQPLEAPKPEEPRTAHVIAPNAEKRSVGKTKSAARQHRLIVWNRPAPSSNNEPAEKSQAPNPKN